LASQAQATFMLMGKFTAGNESGLKSLLMDGHELGNHGLVDRSYAKDSREDFEKAVDECSQQIKGLQTSVGLPECVRWFRAPHGKLSNTMSTVLQERDLTNVMCDTYACCPLIQDGDFIGRFLAREARHGSIILIHMPEHGFREWCFQGIEELLGQLQLSGLKPVSISKLSELANPLHLES